jgi:hypothetical protein
MRVLLAILTALFILTPAYAGHKAVPLPKPKPPAAVAVPAEPEKPVCLSMDDVLGMAKDKVKVIARLEADPFKVFKTRVADNHQGKIPDEIDGVLILRQEGADASIIVGFSNGCQVSVFLKDNKIINGLLEDNSI